MTKLKEKSPVQTSDNDLVAGLPAADVRRLMQAARTVELAPGEVVLDADAPIKEVLFPETAVLAYVGCYEDGACAEMISVGRNGATPIDALIRGETAAHRCEVQVPGTAKAVPVEAFEALRAKSDAVAEATSEYARDFVDQVMTVAACNAAHAVEERAARWLLDLHDCVPGDDIRITQERMAEMLGVNRSTVSGIVQDFRERGLIATSRGVITITDRKALEAASCDCHRG
ncbi:MAG: Crp/Fnr family transcriptional regulator [Hyphomonadaceae bacterium]|nr:Crp/Fnr family transcriptional regulator [Hyphomonadaceae bacterium]